MTIDCQPHADELLAITEAILALQLPQDRIAIKGLLFRAQVVRNRLIFLGCLDAVGTFDTTFACGPLAGAVDRQSVLVGITNDTKAGTIEGKPDPLGVKGAPVRRRFTLPAGFVARPNSSESTKASGGTMKSPELFIQYTHIDDAYLELALAFSDKLRQDGLDAMIDRYAPNPPEGWPNWMTKQLRDSDYVLVLCSADNLSRFNKDITPPRGVGGTYEAHLIQQYLYETGVVNTKFVPVLLRATDIDYIPDALRAFTHYDVSGTAGYEALLRRLTNQPEVIARALGTIKPLPPRQS
jgi:hypothetical protein